MYAVAIPLLQRISNDLRSKYCAILIWSARFLSSYTGESLVSLLVRFRYTFLFSFDDTDDALKDDRDDDAWRARLPRRVMLQPLVFRSCEMMLAQESARLRAWAVAQTLLSSKVYNCSRAFEVTLWILLDGCPISKEATKW